MKLKTLSLVVLIFAIAAVCPAFGLAINVDQPRINVTIKPGDAKEGSIAVTNMGSSSLGIKAYTEDWIYAPDGSKNFIKAGSSVYSCSNWIALDPASFKLGPKETRNVAYKITAPKNSTGSHVSVIFFEGLIGTVEGIGVTGRIGTIVYQYTEGDLKKEAEIRSFTVMPSVEGGPVNIKVLLANKGNSVISARPKLTIFRGDKQILEKEMNPINMLPADEASGSITISSPELKEGGYKAQIDISYDDRSLQSRSDFSIKKI